MWYELERSKSKSILVILQLYTWVHLLKKEVCSLVPCSWCCLQAGGAQCLPEGKGAGVRSFVPCSACRGEVVLGHIALPLLPACRLPSSRNRKQMWPAGVSERWADTAVPEILLSLPRFDLTLTCSRLQTASSQSLLWPRLEGKGTWLASATQSHVHLFLSTKSYRTLRLSHLPLFSSH